MIIEFHSGWLVHDLSPAISLWWQKGLSPWGSHFFLLIKSTSCYFIDCHFIILRFNILSYHSFIIIWNLVEWGIIIWAWSEQGCCNKNQHSPVLWWGEEEKQIWEGVKNKKKHWLSELCSFYRSNLLSTGKS